MILDKGIMEIQLTSRAAESSPLIYARVAGVLYPILAILGGFAQFFVRQNLIVPGNASATINKIMASESLFRIGFVGDLIGQVIFVLLVLVLYMLLKPVNQTHALLMVIFALVGVPIAMLNLLNQFAVLILLNGADYLTAFEADQLHSIAMLFLDLQIAGITIAQIFWGLWLFPLGYLVFKSGFLPKILGILLMIGCFGYVLDSVTYFLLPNFEATISQFTFIGELLLPLWLLIKGVDAEQWQERSLESA
jgi:hypothetical protein